MAVIPPLQGSELQSSPCWAPRIVATLLARAAPYSDEASLQALFEDFPGQIEPDEHHLAGFFLAFGPGRPQVAPHQLVHALEDDLLVRPLHIKYALVAEHLRAIDLHDGPEEVLQLGRVEG